MGYHARLLVLGFTGWNSQEGLGKRKGLPEFAVNRLLVKHCSLIGVYLYEFIDREPELAERMWAELYEKFESGEYDPVVTGSLEGLEQVSEALQRVQERGQPAIDR